MNKNGQTRLDLQCKCGNIIKIQVNIGKKQSLQPGFVEFPQIIGC